MKELRNENRNERYQNDSSKFQKTLNACQVLTQLELIEFDDFIDEFLYDSYFEKLEKHLKKQKSFFSFMRKNDIEDYNKTVEFLMGIEENYLDMYELVDKYTKHLKDNDKYLDSKLNIAINEQIQYIFKLKIKRYTKLFNMLNRPSSMIKNTNEHMETLLLNR